MQASTARNLAIGCFGLAAVLLFFKMAGAFESKPAPPPQPSRCQHVAPPNKDEYIPAGDWCFHLSTGQTLHLKVGYPAEFGLVDLPEARLDVFDPNGKKHPTKPRR